MADSLAVANAASTWFMAGVIWLVQLVVYPSFRYLDPATFSAAMLDHQRRIGRVVIAPMVVELTASLALLVLRPESALAWAGCVCVAAWGFSTVLIQVPQHARLATAGSDRRALKNLTGWNWLRTLAWSAHGAICAAYLAR